MSPIIRNIVSHRLGLMLTHPICHRFMKTKILSVLVVIAALGTTACNDIPLDEGNSRTEPVRDTNFDAPPLTDANTITIDVDVDRGGFIEMGIFGDRIALEWGDGSITKDILGGLSPDEIGDRAFFRHIYPKKGRYRIRIWSEKVNFFSIHNDTGTTDVRYKTIKFGSCPELYNMSIGFIEETTTLDMSGCPELTYPIIDDCPNLGSVDLSSCYRLTHVLIVDNPLLEKLDLSGHPDLSGVTCIRNSSLREIDLEGCDKLDDIDLSGTAITEFDFGAFPLLHFIGCSNSHMSSIDVTGNPLLGALLCHGLGLTSLDITGNPHLSYLDAGDNALTTLDITGNPGIEYLKIESNNLSTLDVSNQTTFSSIDIRNNSFKKEALNDLFTALPSAVYTRLSPAPQPSRIAFSGNPGAGACDTKIITGKGWKILEIAGK